MAKALKTAGGPSGPARSLSPWLWLVLFVLLIVVFIRLAPLSERIPWVGPQVKALRESGVETGAFWWADVPEVGEAERHFRGLDLIHEKPGGSSHRARDRQDTFLKEESERPCIEIPQHPWMTDTAWSFHRKRDLQKP